jgi:nucleotide sugar dehydrogenase
MKIAVIGMGKIGLPLAVQYARKGHDVIGVDINAATVQSINEGLEPFPEEAHLQEYLSEVIKNGKLKATLNYQEAISDADAIVVVVPLFVDLNAQPDFKAMDSATENIGKHLKPGALVCYETTLPIGTTRNRFTPTLEKLTGMRVGEDFSVVFSPERVFTGRIFSDLRKYPKIVGGVSQKCTRKGKIFYESVLDFDARSDLTKPNGVWCLQSSESAEFVKLAETTYRDVNIALANQFAMYADSIGQNIYEIIEAANSQSYSHLHQPGISVGGHCIPIYPQFYLWNDNKASIVKVARELNKEMPNYAIDRLESVTGSLKEKVVLILGISYRPNVKETAFSGVFDLVQAVENLGGKCQVLDPLFTKEEIEAIGLSVFDGKKEKIKAIIVHTAHQEFRNFEFKEYSNNQVIYDGRNFLTSTPDYDKANVLTLGKPVIGGV